MATNRRDIENQLDDWVNELGQQKNLLNCLVQWLCEDIEFVKRNISAVDRECLIRLTDKLSNSR